MTDKHNAFVPLAVLLACGFIFCAIMAVASTVIGIYKWIFGML